MVYYSPPVYFFTGRCRESPALQAGMNRHNQKIIKFNFRDAPRCARGASQIFDYLHPTRSKGS
jgi:hypothetical protein